MSGTSKIPRTDDPETDKWPHHYEGHDADATTWSDLVYFNSLDTETESVVMAGYGREGDVDVGIQIEGDFGTMSMRASITPKDARKMARSLEKAADIAEDQS